MGFITEGSAAERLKILFDENSFTELQPMTAGGTLITGFGSVGGKTVFAFSQNFENKSGAVGKGYFEKLIAVHDLALKSGAPVVGIYDSFGASLCELSEAVRAIGALNQKVNTMSGVIPQISIVLGTCAGGFATAAASSDVLIMSKNGKLFLSSPALKGKSSSNEAGADILSAAGICAFSAENDDEALNVTRKLLEMLPANNLEASTYFEFEAPDISDADSTNSVQLAKSVADGGSLFEMYAGCGTSFTAFCTVEGGVTAVVATPEKLNSIDCGKMSSFIKFCDAFSIPVVTFVNTKEFDTDDSEMTLLPAVSKLFATISETTAPKISIITGSAIGTALIGFCSKNAGSDLCFCLPNAVVSPVPPKAGALALFNDRLAEHSNEAEGIEAITKLFINENATAEKACENGITDGIIESGKIRAFLSDALTMLASKRVTGLPKKHSTI